MSPSCIIQARFLPGVAYGERATPFHVASGGENDVSIIAWIVLGLIAGWLAGVLVRGSGYGVIGDIVLGIVGALVGGWIASQLIGVDVTGFNLESVLIAVLGAIVVIVIARLVSGRTAAV